MTVVNEIIKNVKTKTKTVWRNGSRNWARFQQLCFVSVLWSIWWELYWLWIEITTSLKYCMSLLSLGWAFPCPCFTFLVQTHSFQDLASYRCQLLKVRWWCWIPKLFLSFVHTLRKERQRVMEPMEASWDILTRHTYTWIEGETGVAQAHPSLHSDWPKFLFIVAYLCQLI